MSYISDDGYKFPSDIPSERYNYSFEFDFEKNFDQISPILWMRSHWSQALVISAMYLIFIVAAKAGMARLKPTGFGLRKELVVWNLGLGLFSVVGTVRYFPSFWYTLTYHGIRFLFCTCNFYSGAPAFWSEAFAFSKVIELGDTAMLVLRRRPVIFLHWWHHISVMIFTWHGFKDHTAAGRTFIMMNYAVHSVMYTYYAIRAAGIKTPKWIPMSITLLQLSQMIAGIMILIATYWYRFIQGDVECRQTPENQALGTVVYASYFVLFCNFFYNAYLKPKPKRTEPAAGRKHNGAGDAAYACNGAPAENGHVSNGTFEHHKMK